MEQEFFYQAYGRNFFVEPASSQFVNCVFQDEYQIRCLKDFDVKTILDVGSHVGSFTVMCHEFWPEAKIVAVEPHPESYEMLCKNTQHIPQEKLLKLNVAVTKTGNKCQLSSFVSHSRVGDYVTDIWDDLKPRPKDFGILVNSITPKQLLEQMYAFGMEDVQLLKLDCEGAEYVILPEFHFLGVMKKVGWIRGEWHCREMNTLLEQAMEDTHKFHIHPNKPHDVGMFIAHRR